jgi:hypothetical protein
MHPLALREYRKLCFDLAWRNVLRAVPVECGDIDINDALAAGVVVIQLDFGEFPRYYVPCVFYAQVTQNLQAAPIRVVHEFLARTPATISRV